MSSTRRALHTIPKEPPWRAPSLAAVSKAVHGRSNTHSEDAEILLILLSFLKSEKIPLELLSCGATPRKRWNVQGEIEEVDAIHAGLVPELGSLLSDVTRLNNAFHELDISSVVSKDLDHTYRVDDAVVGRIHRSLSPELHYFWRFQALVIVFRSISWKYIEPTIFNMKELFQLHLKHTLQAYRNDFEHLPANARADLVLTLVDTSRLPKMEWKRFAIAQAKTALEGLIDPYIQSCIAQAECILYRISGDQGRAINALDSPTLSRLLNIADTRMHSAAGLTTIQRSLNSVQADDLFTAEKLLKDWIPLNQNSSAMEEVVLFRKNMILGRVLRFQGKFDESLAHLEKSRNIAKRRKDLNFDEDLLQLTCDLADTLREIDDPLSAERHLRTEIARRNQHGGHSPGGCVLELSLAESLFAQRRFEDAEKLCSDIVSRPRLLKFEKLRLHITLAKLRHLGSDLNGALSHWTQAMMAISKFPMTNGYSTRIIIISTCDILRRQGHNWSIDTSKNQLASLDALAKPGSDRYWIAGFRHWLEYLQSQNNSLRNRM